MLRNLSFQGTDGAFQVVSRRNCSVSPAGLFKVYLAIAGVSLAIGAGFAWAGAWLVLPFAGVEVAALGVAFLVNGWHATDHERVELTAEGLTVEVASGARTERHAFDRRRVRVSTGPGSALLVGDRSTMLEIGRHLDAQGREGLRAELVKRLRN